MLPTPAAITQTVQQLQAHFGAAPTVAVVLGSGWGGVTQYLKDAKTVAYAELAAFEPTGVEGHAGTLVVGHIGAQRVAVLAGRRHTYENNDCTGMAGAIRSLSAWGVQVLVQTNAAGSLRAHMPPGSLMLIADHINAPQRSPLVGETGNARFVDMVDAYDGALRAQARALASARGTRLSEGTYLWALGPQFETPAEIRMFAAWGADTVGMSTVPETILARHAGLRVLGLSLITNLAAGLSSEALTHAATLAQAQAAGETAAGFLAALLENLGSGVPKFNS
jgi:inosine/guanosine/xanthosine phosphorylase family protein